MAEAWGGNGRDHLGRVAYDDQATSGVHLRTSAWLDASSHAPIWWVDHNMRSFYVASVGAYHVEPTDVSSNREIWGLITVDEATGLSDACLCSAMHTCLVRVTHSRGGMFDASTLEERRTRRHLYQLGWERASLAEGGGCITLLGVGNRSACVRVVLVYACHQGCTLTHQ